MIARMLVVFVLAAPLQLDRGWSVGKSRVERIVDAEAGVVCYVIAQEHCVGDCAYSPAISCVKVSQ